jgi:hypothetical protein
MPHPIPHFFSQTRPFLQACAAPAPAPAAIPNAISISTPVLAPTSVPNGAAVITQGFWDAILANNIDAAMTFVADDVQPSGGPEGGFYDKATFAAFMATKLEAGFTHEISDLRVVSEDTVRYDMKVYDEKGRLFVSGLTTLQVADGKIIKIKLP